MIVGIEHKTEGIPDIDPVTLERVDIFSVFRRRDFLEVLIPIVDGVIGEHAQCGFAVTHRLRQAEFVVQLVLSQPEIAILKIGPGPKGRAFRSEEADAEKATNNEAGDCLMRHTIDSGSTQTLSGIVSARVGIVKAEPARLAEKSPFPI
jgi:hypothetical protein